MDIAFAAAVAKLGKVEFGSLQFALLIRQNVLGADKYTHFYSEDKADLGQFVSDFVQNMKKSTTVSMQCKGGKMTMSFDMNCDNRVQNVPHSSKKIEQKKKRNSLPVRAKGPKAKVSPGETGKTTRVLRDTEQRKKRSLSLSKDTPIPNKKAVIPSESRNKGKATGEKKLRVQAGDSRVLRDTQQRNKHRESQKVQTPAPNKIQTRSKDKKTAIPKKPAAAQNDQICKECGAQCFFVMQRKYGGFWRFYHCSNCDTRTKSCRCPDQPNVLRLEPKAELVDALRNQPPVKTLRKIQKRGKKVVTYKGKLQYFPIEKRPKCGKCRVMSSLVHQKKVVPGHTYDYYRWHCNHCREYVGLSTEHDYYKWHKMGKIQKKKQPASHRTKRVKSLKKEMMAGPLAGSSDGPDLEQYSYDGDPTTSNHQHYDGHVDDDSAIASSAGPTMGELLAQIKQEMLDVE